MQCEAQLPVEFQFVHHTNSIARNLIGRNLNGEHSHSPDTVLDVQRAYFWFSKSAPGGSVCDAML